jgi:hypothetical protein
MILFCLCHFVKAVQAGARISLSGQAASSLSVPADGDGGESKWGMQNFLVRLLVAPRNKQSGSDWLKNTPHSSF